MSASGVIPLADFAFWQDPYPTLDRLREQHRTAVTDSGVKAIMRYADCEELLKGDGFVNEGVSLLERRGFRAGDALLEWRRLTLGAINGESHRRIRALAGRAITHQTVEYMRPRIRELTDALIEPHMASGEIDVAADLARRLPLAVISEFLGISEADRDRVADTVLRGAARAFGVNVTAEIRAEVNAMFEELMGFIAGLIAERRMTPKADALSRLMSVEECGDRLTQQEIVVLFLNLFSGATESTASAMTSGAWLFARYPEQAALVRENPGLLKPAVEEILRLYPPNLLLANKISAREQDLFGLHFAVGEQVVIPLGAPNRDPRVWDAPDNFDVRREPKRHFTFSIGEHFCLGQALARCLLQEFFAVLLARFEIMELLVETPRWIPFGAVNQMESLPLRFAS
jgi:cytochrome P450